MLAGRILLNYVVWGNGSVSARLLNAIRSDDWAIPHVGLSSLGEIPAFKVGGTWRLRQSEIDQCINDQTRAGAKKEVMRKREQQKSSEQPVSPGRTARRSRQRA